MENISNQEREPSREETLEILKEASKRGELENEAAGDFLEQEVKKGTIDLQYLFDEAKRTGYNVLRKNVIDIYNERGFSTKNIPE